MGRRDFRTRPKTPSLWIIQASSLDNGPRKSKAGSAPLQEVGPALARRSAFSTIPLTNTIPSNLSRKNRPMLNYDAGVNIGAIIRIKRSSVYKFAMDTTREATDNAQAKSDTITDPISKERPGTLTDCIVLWSFVVSDFIPMVFYECKHR